MAGSFTPTIISVVFCGIEKEDLIGRDVADFYRDPADREQLVQELKTKGMVQDMDLAGRKADGTPLWASVFARTLTYENEEAILAGFYDITDRKRTEQDLSRLEIVDTPRTNVSSVRRCVYEREAEEDV